MKTYFKILLITALFATGCSPSYMGSAVYEDDIYYNPNEAPLIVQKVEANSPAVKKANSLAPATANQSATKIKPTSVSENIDDRDFAALQKKYTDILNNDSIGSVDTLIYEGDAGYYLGGFDGSDYDRAEAERLREMYPQGFGYYDNTGYNTAMWLAGDPDWNVYVDGNNVWWTPTWTNNRFYNGYNYSTMRYGNTFAYNYPHYSGFSWGFGDSWYWDLSFGWGYPHYSYGHHYNHYGHYNYGHGNYYRDRDYARATDRYGNRRASTNKPVSTNGSTKSHLATSNRRVSSANSTKAGVSTSTRRLKTAIDSDGRRIRAAARYSTRSSYGSTKATQASSSTRRSTYGTSTKTNTARSTYNNGTQRRNTYSSGTRTNSQSNRNSYSNTRRSTSPSYNKPKTSSRPSYNKSSKTRSSSYSKSGTRSSYSKVKSNSSRSKPTYKSGSSRSSRSSYNSGSSSRKSSSSSYRSSGSSSRSSGSSVRSSGSSRSSSGSSSSSNNSKSRSTGRR